MQTHTTREESSKTEEFKRCSSLSSRFLLLLAFFQFYLFIQFPHLSSTAMTWEKLCLPASSKHDISNSKRCSSVKLVTITIVLVADDEEKDEEEDEEEEGRNEDDDESACVSPF